MIIFIIFNTNSFSFRWNVLIPRSIDLTPGHRIAPGQGCPLLIKLIQPDGNSPFIRSSLSFGEFGRGQREAVADIFRHYLGFRHSTSTPRPGHPNSSTNFKQTLGPVINLKFSPLLSEMCVLDDMGRHRHHVAQLSWPAPRTRIP